MTLDDLVTEIARLCASSLSFGQKGVAIVGHVMAFNRERLLAHLDEAGIIPEKFEHDSTEEKLFAKYCDALLARALNEIGMRATLIEERADAADVVAALEGYRVVGDAKAFRLSRTAKNQKDFKVEALNQWRRGAEYACLVCPLYQYPVSNSQIYQQASSYNVTLLSYAHLAFLIRNPPKAAALRLLWEVAKSIPPSKSAKVYWAAVGHLIEDITGTDKRAWDQAVESAATYLPKQAAGQIAFWEAQRARAMALPVEAARLELVEALKINSKIAVIRNSVAELQESKETFET